MGIIVFMVWTAVVVFLTRKHLKRKAWVAKRYGAVVVVAPSWLELSEEQRQVLLEPSITKEVLVESIRRDIRLFQQVQVPPVPIPEVRDVPVKTRPLALPRCREVSVWFRLDTVGKIKAAVHRIISGKKRG